MKKKAAIYCRLSEEDRDKTSETEDSNSIKNQKSMLSQYALEQGWEIYRIYSDDNYTGSDRNRPEFRQLIKDAGERHFEIILCKTQSRFTRELELVEKYINGLFPLWGIRFIGLVDNADTDIKGNKKARQINGLVNEWYLEDMSENIKSVLTDKRKKGLHIGSSALYGYKKDENNKGRLLVDERAAEVVKEIFSLYLEGKGKTAIARILNERGVPTPGEYKRNSGGIEFSGKASLWQYYTVDSILKNEMYIGNMVQGRYGSESYKTKRNKARPKENWYVVEATHQAIIDKDTWERAADIRKSRTRVFKGGERGCFSGKVRCAECGALLRSGKQKSGVRYLQCQTRYISPSGCRGSYIREDKLEEAVLSELKVINEKYLNVELLLKKLRIKENISEKLERLEQNKEKYGKMAEDMENAAYSLYMDKVRGIIGPEDYAKLSVKLQAETEITRKKFKELTEQINSYKFEKYCSGREKYVIEKYIYPEKLNTAAISCLIDYIKVQKREADGIQNIEIHWKF